MSVGAHSVTVAPRFERSTPADHHELSDTQRQLIRVASFTALALYSVIRWGRLLHPTPTWRLLGLLALALVIAGAVPLMRRIGPPPAVMLAFVVCLVAFPVAGLQWHSFIHLRIAVSARHIGDGLVALPNAVVPYSGSSHTVRLVIMLGAAVLLLDAACVVAFAPAAFGDARRAAAALPLIALSVVPSTLVRPQFPYLQGLALFALLAAFMWGDRVRRDAAGPALGVAALAGVLGALLAPHVDQHKALINYRAWTAAGTHHRIDTFEWDQSYGPLNWPHAGHQILAVTAKTADYWKAENLDLFNGVAWVVGASATDAVLPRPSAVTLAKWTQTIRVTDVGLTTNDVIAPGDELLPTGFAAGVIPGIDPGRWLASRALVPGSSYTVTSYSPHPSAAALSHAGKRYPYGALSGDLTLTVPIEGTPPEAFTQATFGPFHSAKAQLSQGGVPVSGPGIAHLMRDSPYEQAYVLARHLVARSKTPYAFVMSVMRYLSRGFAYDQNTPVMSYPLARFLFKTKRGYCQQFSGAMALLLRMGGVPTRIGEGFTSGVYNRSAHQWEVSDVDAHAWVEVWFPHYGWVRFDPTPPVAPELQGITALSVLKSLATGGSHGVRATPRGVGSGPGVTSTSRHNSGAGLTVLLIFPGLLALAALVWVVRVLARPALDADGLLAELERALARTRRPLQPQTTLSALEHRFRDSTDAAAYVRALRLARYGGVAVTPARRGRRALRAQLRDGLGLAGRLRALWALPPRPRGPRPTSGRDAGGLGPADQ